MIGNNVWIASGSVISSGVTIGGNSIVMVNSVVVDNIEANFLYGGIPAKKIKSL